MAANRATGVVQQVLVDSGDNANLRATAVAQQVLIGGFPINLLATQVVQQVLRSVDDAPEATGGGGALLIGV